MRTLIVILFVCITGTIECQSFYRTYGSPTVNEGGNTIVASPDGNILIGGYKNDSAMVMKSDPLGNVIWIRTFLPTSGSLNNVSQIEITADGFIIGIGNALNNNNLYGDGFHFKMDINGNLLWVNRVNDSRRIFNESIIAKSTTEYLVVADIYDLSAPTAADVIIHRVDASNGNVIASTPRFDYITSNPYIDDPYSATANTAGTRMYTTGRIYVNGSAPSGMRPYLSKFDMNGNHLSTSYLSWTAANSARIYGTDIVYRNDSLTICYFGDVSGSSSNFSVGLIHTDTSGNVAWSRDFDITSTGSEIASKVLLTPYGYVIVGYAIGGNNDIFMIGVSMTGALLWSRTYGSAASTENFLVTTCPIAEVIGSQIYFTGQTINGSNRDLIVGATDLNGNLTCIPTPTIAVTASNNGTSKTNITLGSLAESLTFTSGSSSALQPINDACSANLNLGNDTMVCGTLILNATTPGATSYQWQDGSTSPIFTVSNAGVYWVIVEINCCSFTDSITVSGGTLPSAAFTNSGSNCSTTINFSNTSVNGTSYQWNFGDQSTSTSSSPTHTYASPGTYTVTLISNNGCGADTVQNIVTIGSGIVVTAAANPSSLCSPSAVTLSAQQSGGSGNIIYNWSPGNLSGQSTSVTPQNSTTYTVIATDASGCSDTSSVSVQVATFSGLGPDLLVCQGGSVVINAFSTGSSYNWSTGDTSSSINVNQAGVYTVVVTNGNCIFSDSIVVTDGGSVDVIVPNVFTPNGDAINESFGVANTISEGYSLQIFDRWGKEIFSTIQPTSYWDGNHNGKECVPGVYYWLLNYTDCAGQSAVKSGFVELIR